MIDYKMILYIVLGLIILFLIGYSIDKQTDKGIKKLERIIRGYKRK